MTFRSNLNDCFEPQAMKLNLAQALLAETSGAASKAAQSTLRDAEESPVVEQIKAKRSQTSEMVKRKFIRP